MSNPNIKEIIDKIPDRLKSALSQSMRDTEITGDTIDRSALSNKIDKTDVKALIASIVDNSDDVLQRMFENHREDLFRIIDLMNNIPDNTKNTSLPQVRKRRKETLDILDSVADTFNVY